MSILKLERSVDEFIQFKHGLLPVSIFLMIAKAKTPMTYKIEPVEKKPVRKIFFGLIHIGGSFSITQFTLSKDGLKFKKKLEKIWAS